MSIRFTNVEMAVNMQVGAISNQSFSGKIRETKKGNEYETSNEGKKYIPLIQLGAIGTSMGLKNAIGDFNPTDYLLSDTGKAGKVGVGAVLGTVALLGATTIGIGAIYDAVINKTRRSDADKFAETGKVEDRTNKGKKIGAGIGLGGSVLGLLLSHKRLNNLNVSNFISIALEVATWTSFGAIYDYAVNKSRTKLAYKADLAAKNEAKLEAKMDEKITQAISEKNEEVTVKKD